MEIFFLIFVLSCFTAFEEESEEDTDDEGVGNQANLLTGNTAVPVEMLKTYILQHSADSHFKDEFTVGLVMSVLFKSSDSS